jgi:hypothetical protein
METHAIRVYRSLLASALVAYSLPGLAVSDCPVAHIVAPASGARVEEARPTIVWRALPGVSRYRVQLESRVPEGRIVASTDALVEGTQFVPPANLADSRAAVKALVTAACGTDAPHATVSAQPARFYVDLAPRCPAVGNLTVEAAAAAATGGSRVMWAPSKAATAYEVAVYAMPDGKRLAGGETPAASYTLAFREQAVMVAVRPHCGAAVGPAVYGMVPAAP